MPRKKSEAPKPSTTPCSVCGGAMKLVRTIPAAGIMPALYSFNCDVCGCPRTEEARPLAA